MFDTIKAKLFNGASKATSVAIMVALLATTLFPTFAEAQVSPQSIWKRVGTTISPIIPSWDLVVDDLTVNGTFSGSGLAQNILKLESDGDIVATSTNSGYGLVFDYFTATSTTATSTFAGGLSIGSTLVGNATFPTLAFGDTDTGFYENADDSLQITIAGTQEISFGTQTIDSVNSDGFRIYHSRGASGTSPIYTFGDDSDTGLNSGAADRLSLIAGGTELLRLNETGTATSDQLIIGPAGVIGSASTPSLAFGDGDTGWYESADDTFRLSIGGINTMYADTTEFRVAKNFGASLAYVDTSSTVPTFTFQGDMDTGVGRSAANALSLISGATEMLTLRANGTATTTIFANTDVKVGISTSTPWAKFSISGGAIVVDAPLIATSTSMTVDWLDGNQQTIRHGTGATTIGFSNYIPGQVLALEVCNPGSTAGAITFSGVLWPGGTAPTHTTTADKCDLYFLRAGNGTSTPVIYGGFNQDY